MTYRINNDEDLSILLHKFNCESVSELSEFLFRKDYSIVIDDRPNAEYSEINAQSSEEFFDESLTLEEIEELTNKRKLYV